MNIEKYQELTGKTVTPPEKTAFNANLRRTKAMLETLLGFTLNPQNLYNELGKAQTTCACPNVDTSKLLPPDDTQGTYKLFSFNKLDKYFHVDPFREIYQVKLVYGVNDGEFVTMNTLNNAKPQFGRDGIGNYIEKCLECMCSCDCDDCVQLAVDADWIDCLPDDILYLWCDMIDYQFDCKKGLKSESIEGHSWTRAETRSPEELPHNVLLLKRYAGPYGSVAVMPT